MYIYFHNFFCQYPVFYEQNSVIFSSIPIKILLLSIYPQNNLGQSSLKEIRNIRETINIITNFNIKICCGKITHRIACKELHHLKCLLCLYPSMFSLGLNNMQVIYIRNGYNFHYNYYFHNFFLITYPGYQKISTMESRLTKNDSVPCFSNNRDFTVKIDIQKLQFIIKCTLIISLS